MEVCVICQQPLGKYHNEAKGVHNQPCYLVGDLPCATLTDKGCASIKKAIEEREDANAIQPSPGERVTRTVDEIIVSLIRLRRVYVSSKELVRLLSKGRHLIR